MSKYPYIQNKKYIEKGNCPVCNEEKSILRIEWRVDWSQGNCEFEDICQSCLNKRENEEKKKQDAYIKRMEPIWEKQLKRKQEREINIENIIDELGLSLKKYDNGQWAIGDKLDWWTTTGTAIERKNRKQYYLSFNKPQEIKEVLINLIK